VKGCHRTIKKLSSKGVPQDYKEAIKWYSKSAEQNYVKSQVMLGYMYYHGEGVQQEYVLAHMWFNLAAVQGNVNASELRDIAAEKMTPSQIEKAQKLAREWKALQNDS
jgi:TPR repeat protein